MRTSNVALAGRYLVPAQRLTPRRFRFNETKLAALPLPATGQVEYQDALTPGFVCRVSRTARTLDVRRRQRGAGKFVFVRLGALGDKPLAEYRIAAKTIGAQLAGGASPTTPLPKRGAAPESLRTGRGAPSGARGRRQLAGIHQSHARSSA